MGKVAIKEGSFFTVQSFMRTQLHLDGPRLLVYAIVYGFSQDGESYFNGSVEYLSAWTGYSESTVRRSLQSLCDDKLLIKVASKNDGKSPNKYRALWSGYDRGVTVTTQGCHGDYPGGVMVTPNNIEDNIEDKVSIVVFNDIVDYLNLRTGKKYTLKNKKTRSLIHARLEEGFDLDDFKAVIDNRCDKWLGTPQEEYLRPITLFGTKFESYLNAKSNKKEAFDDSIFDAYDS